MPQARDTAQYSVHGLWVPVPELWKREEGKLLQTAQAGGHKEGRYGNGHLVHHDPDHAIGCPRDSCCPTQLPGTVR